MKQNVILKLFPFFLLLIYSSLLFLIYFLQIPQAYAQDPVIGKRTISFVNSCPFPVWFGFASGAVENVHPSFPGDTTCNTNTDCHTGSICTYQNCFWINPTPANGQYQLAANGGTNSVSIPIYQNSLVSLWSGAIAGRTNCTGSSCQTADCGTGGNKCPEGRGFSQPATEAEFTFLKTGDDVYDVEVINGVNIPVQMAPNFLTLKTCTGNCDQPYTCGSPGAIDPITQVGSCSWKFNPPSNDYKWVVSGGAACNTDTNCQNPNVCGLSYDPTRSPMFQKTCGKLQGYWTADEVCGNQKNYGAPFNCAQPLPQGNLTLWNLYACAAIGSCYSSNAANTCCGCVNWDQIGISVPPSPITTACNNVNPTWTSNVLPKLSWLKQACPTAYTYPYDDMSSTFTCQQVVSGLNVANYTITFCPSGVTGGVLA